MLPTEIIQKWVRIVPKCTQIDFTGGSAPSELTAESVKGFFQGLPNAVSAHPDGQQAIKQVMELLEKLDTAAKAAMAAKAPLSCAPASPAGQEAEDTLQDMQMDLDDEVLQQMAEAAVGPAEEGGSSEEDRATKVAETKARLKAKKGDLEKGMSKVKKTSAKK